MVNMTVVVEKKDLIKYSWKILGLIIVVLLFTKIINLDKSKVNIFNTISEFDETKLVSCIDDNLHIAKIINGKEQNLNNFMQIEPLKVMIESELTMISKIETEDKESENDTSEEKNENITNISQEGVEQAKTNLETMVLENDVPESYTNSYKSVEIKNDTEFDITEDMLVPDIDITNKNVIIYHTHTCESYTPSDMYNYEQTGVYRTTDLDFTVARVGDELEKQLISYGFNVIHDKTYHDYPSYNGSYGRSQETVENILQEQNDVDIIIDLHRDAIADYSYAPTVKIGEDFASQLMFVIGTDGGGLEHPNWGQNLKFASKVQEKANEMYPGLFRPMILRNSRYNQHLAKGACIIEVGATGNTLEQSICSMKYLAKVLDEIVK